MKSTLKVCMIGILVFMTGLMLHAENLILENQTINTDEDFVSDDVITTQNNFIVAAPAAVNFIAKNQINLKPGFHAKAGSTFKAKLGDTVTLTIISDVGDPTPAAGIRSFLVGETISASIHFPETTGVRMTTSWSGTGSVPASGTGNTVNEFVILEDSTLTWNSTFEYKLNCLIEGEGEISGNLDGWYKSGETVTITVEPTAGHKFLRWSGTTKQSVFSKTISQTMDQPHLVKAVIAEESEAFNQTTNWYVLTLRPGWNLISLPITPLDPNVSSVFPASFCEDCSIPGFTEQIALWDPIQQDYATPTAIEPLKGYWFRYDGKFTISHIVKGTILPDGPMVSLAKGLNLIGPATTIPLPVSINFYLEDFRVQSSVNGWDGSRYFVPFGGFEHGSAYWILTAGSFSVNLGNSTQDSDGDGIYDIWEATFNSGASAGDSDGDGILDIDEHNLGLNPNGDDTVGTSYFHYGYDAIGRLKNASGPQSNILFTHDEEGNIIDTSNFSSF